MTKSITVNHPGRHLPTKDQRKAAGVPDGYVAQTNRSGYATTYVPAQVAADEDAPLAVPHEDLTVAELREYAAEKAVDLGDATKKADILAAISDAGL